jgi:GntR family transcriptional repressor for pyruvate dehydrogenase complex
MIEGISAAVARRSLDVERIQPAHEQVASQIRLMIQAGTLAVGERLPAEADLAGVFGVSRATIIEALRLLSAQGLVAFSRGSHSGGVISAPHDEQLRQSIELHLGIMSGIGGLTAEHLNEARKFLEIPSAGLAALRRTEQDIENIRASIASERAQDENWSRSLHSHDFHLEVLKAAANPLLELMAPPIFRSIRVLSLSDARDHPWGSILIAHERILDAIVRGDSIAAESEMREHLRDPATTAGPM